MKILIVDDEPFFIEQLNSIIQDYAKTIQKKAPAVAEAYSALEALDMIPLYQPDLIMTDIKMTAMDGIELSRTLQLEYPEIIVVIISGYSSFDYAREALRANVMDYILKPIDPESVQSLLNKIDLRVRNSKYRKMKKAFQTIMDAGAMTNQAELNLAKASYDHYSVYFIQRSDSLIDPAASSGDDTHQRFIVNVNQRLGNESTWLYLSPYQPGFVVIAGRQRDEPFAEDDLIQEITSYFSVENLPLSFVFMPEISGIADLKSVSKQLREVLYANHIIGTPQRLRFPDIAPAKTDRKELQFQQIHETKISLYIAQKNWQTLRKEVERLFSAWKHEQCPSILVESSLKKMMRMLCRTTNQDALFSKNLEAGVEEIVYSSISFEDAAEAVWGLMNHALKLENDQNDSNDKYAVQFRQIDAYLNANLNEPITMTQLCALFHISTTNLYNLFRNYGKASFIEYFTALRINHAKELMNRYPEMLSKEIAELVGYSDQHYFSRVFKNTEGVTPTEFRTAVQQPQSKTI